MAPIFRFIISSGSKKKEARYACLSEAKASHSHKMWTEVSSSIPQSTSGVVTQPHYIKMYSQGVMSSKKASDNPGLCPIKGK